MGRSELAGIYALVEPGRHADPVAFIGALLRGGIRLFQIRAKTGIAADRLRELVDEVHAGGGTAIVNDDVELALVADGVHLGVEDLERYDLADVRRCLGRRIIGLSCGTPAEARGLDARLVDYIGVGPIFATASKADAGGPIGVNGVRAVAAAAALPVAAIGGITLERLPRVRESGAHMAAVISALSGSLDPETAARELVSAWGS